VLAKEYKYQEIKLIVTLGVTECSILKFLISAWTRIRDGLDSVAE
jgi:hypothetical protein